jgi:hypothetical protein
MSGKTVKLQAGDETIVEVPRSVAVLCLTVDNQLKDLGDDIDMLPLPNVTGPTLKKVVEFITHYHEHPDELGEPVTAQSTNPEDDTKPRKPKKIPELTECDLFFVVLHFFLFVFILFDKFPNFHLPFCSFFLLFFLAFFFFFFFFLLFVKKV